jgi:lipoate-protein ligase B
MPLPICQVLRLGLVPYAEAWKLQDTLAAQVAAGEHPPALLLLEHPHTYTFGRRGQAKNLLWGEAELARRGIQVHWVDRGGDVTYHGPGQLVGYPLLPLSTQGLQVEPGSDSARLPQADYVGYVRRLEETLVRALLRLGVTATRIDGLTGVWVPQPGAQPAKLAAIGVKVDARGITRHGFALNVNPDMSYWQGIIGCGLEGVAVTCLADLLPAVPSMDQVCDEVINAFGQVFGYQMLPSG